MKSFNLYEFAGLLIPGAFFIFCLPIILPELLPWLNNTIFKEANNELDFTNLGLLLVLSFVTGQLLQSIAGYLQEKFWWDKWNMKPTGWIREFKLEENSSMINKVLYKICNVKLSKLNNSPSLLSTSQIERLLNKINQTLSKSYGSLEEIEQDSWDKIVFEIEILLKDNKRGQEIAENIGHYNFFKGLIVCLLLLLLISFVRFIWLYEYSLLLEPKESIFIMVILLFCIIISLYRMHRFAINYTRDLFLQFINMKDSTKK